MLAQSSNRITLPKRRSSHDCKFPPSQVPGSSAHDNEDRNHNTSTIPSRKSTTQLDPPKETHLVKPSQQAGNTALDILLGQAGAGSIAAHGGPAGDAGDGDNSLGGKNGSRDDRRRKAAGDDGGGGPARGGGGCGSEC